MPAKLDRLFEGQTFTVALQKQQGGKPDRLIFIGSNGYQYRRPETGTIIEELGPEVPEGSNRWVFREANEKLYPMKGSENAMSTSFRTGTYRCLNNLLFG